MSYQPLEKLLSRTNNSIYDLVILASQRALELAEGMPKLIEYPSSDKPATIALEEIMEGKVRVKPAKKK